MITATNCLMGWVVNVAVGKVRLRGLKKLKYRIKSCSLLSLNNVVGLRVPYFKQGFMITQMGRWWRRAEILRCFIFRNVASGVCQNVDLSYIIYLQL
jgi:hypothetical protein